VYSPPKITHPGYEPWSLVLKPAVVATKQKQQDEILIAYSVYFRKISDLLRRAEVGTPDSKHCNTTKSKRDLSPPSSLNSSFCEESMVIDEDALPSIH
jgi:hypothetical protein